MGGELHFFGTSPPAQQLRVVTTNLGDGDERKTEAKVRGGEEGNGEQEEVWVKWLSDACVARSVRLRVCPARDSRPAKLGLARSSRDAVQLPALGAADHTEAFSKSQVTSHPAVPANQRR